VLLPNRTLPKIERLRSRKLIKELFSKGSSFFVHPFKILVLPQVTEGEMPHQVLFTVPKKHFKHAVDRNRIRRQIKELYRLHKEKWPPTSQPNQHYLIAILYLAKEKYGYDFLEQKFLAALERLKTKSESGPIDSKQ
jgi:ribonuclease P protein component